MNEVMNKTVVMSRDTNNANLDNSDVMIIFRFDIISKCNDAHFLHGLLGNSDSKFPNGLLYAYDPCV